MHSFGDSFGFRRSNEHLHSGPESRHRIPATETDWLQGDLVTIDPASGGYLKVAAANSPVVPGFTGLLIQFEEHVTADEINQYGILNTRDLSRTRPGLLANIVTGAGLKVWVKNLSADTRAGRKSYDAETRVDLTGIAVGDTVGWDGTKYVKVTNADYVVGTVTQVTSSGIEFVLAR